MRSKVLLPEGYNTQAYGRTRLITPNQEGVTMRSKVPMPKGYNTQAMIRPYVYVRTNLITLKLRRGDHLTQAAMSRKVVRRLQLHRPSAAYLHPRAYSGHSWATCQGAPHKWGGRGDTWGVCRRAVAKPQGEGGE